MNLIQRLTARLGSFTTRKRGEEYIFTCPKCRRDKLEVNPKRKLFHCFRCGYHGGLRKILRDLHIEHDVNYQDDGGVELLFNDPAAAKAVKEMLDDAINRINDAADKAAHPMYGGANASAGQEFDSIEIPGYKPLPEDFRAGWPAPVFLFLQSKNLLVTDALRMKMGMSTEKRFNGRIIIPIIEDGRFVCYVARSLDGHNPVKELSGPDKGDYVYGLDEIGKDEDVFIVEGIFDAEALRRWHIKAVAILGSNITDVQVGKILAKHPASITLMFDGDVAGREATFKAATKLSARPGPNIYCVNLPDDTDPDEMKEAELKELIQYAWGMKRPEF